MKTHAITIVKLLLIFAALGLDAYGRLDGSITQLMTVAIGAFGLQGVVKAWHEAQGAQASAPMSQALVTQVLALMRPSPPPPPPPPPPPAAATTTTTTTRIVLTRDKPAADNSAAVPPAAETVSK